MSLNTANNINKKGFSGLSDLISDISEDIADAYHCPKCGHINDNSEEECLQCGIIYSKYRGPVSQRRSQVPKTVKTSASSLSKSNSQCTASGNTIVEDEPSSEKMTIGSLKLCTNPKCVGSIGDDGKCEICGKSEGSEPTPNEPVSVCKEGASVAGGDGRSVNCGKKTVHDTKQLTEPGGGKAFGYGCGCLVLAIPIVVLFFIFGSIVDSDNSSNNAQTASQTRLPDTSKPSSTSQVKLTDKPSSSSPNELSFTIQKPPFGTNNVLTYPQIRYCLAEKIRLDAMESIVNSYSDSEINKFNSLIDDYNSRCSQYRYRSGALQSSRRTVETERWKLQEEGRKRVAIWRAPSSTSPKVNKEQPATATQIPKPKPDQLVLDTQKKLTELGYNPGPVDGLMGRKTREAIKAFQQDVGLSVSGSVSESLLNNLKSWKIKNDTVADEVSQTQPQTISPSIAPPPPQNSYPKNRSKKELKNLQTCLKGIYPSLCDHSLLTPPERAQVDAAERRENLTKCLKGIYPSLCDHSLLTPSERAQVDAAERRENLTKCLKGIYPSLCDHSLLTPSERAQVDAAERRAK